MVAGMGAPEKNLEASDDGQNFRLGGQAQRDSDAPEHTISFPARNGEVFPRHLQADASSSHSRLGGGP